MNETLMARTASVFQAAFGEPAAIIVQAPGRVNLIGEHTDYNDGLVLPCAIDYRTVIAARRRDDGVVRVVAADYDDARDAITRTIITLPEYLRRSLTWDQGAELAQHARLKIDASVHVYFCALIAHASAAPTRTPMGCCVSTSQKAPI